MAYLSAHLNTFIKRFNGKLVNRKNIELDTLKSYERQAKACIIKIGQKFSKKTLNSMMRDEEFISHVVFAFIKADMDYIPNKGNRVVTHRYNAAWWIVSGYLSHIEKNMIKRTDSLYRHISGRDHEIVELYQTLPIKQLNPLDHLIEKEKKYKARTLMNIGGISLRDRKIVRQYYFDGLIMEKIGQMHNISKQRVAQILATSIHKIKEHVNDMEYWKD